MSVRRSVRPSVDPGFLFSLKGDLTSVTAPAQRTRLMLSCRRPCFVTILNFVFPPCCVDQIIQVIYIVYYKYNYMFKSPIYKTIYIICKYQTIPLFTEMQTANELKRQINDQLCKHERVRSKHFTTV